MPIKCEFCGMEYENDPGKFCERCGRVLARMHLEAESDAPDHKTCLKCGHRNAPDATICVNCGDLLYSPQA